MTNLKKEITPRSFDSKEFELPETTFVRDIENRVFQNIVAQCVSKVKDVVLVENSFIGNILSRGNVEGISSVQAEQDNQNHSLNIRIELNIAYGVCIPEKAEEIQSQVAEELTRLTGLHVACVHVVFKDLISTTIPKRGTRSESGDKQPAALEDSLEDEYTDEFK